MAISYSATLRENRATTLRNLLIAGGTPTMKILDVSEVVLASVALTTTSIPVNNAGYSASGSATTLEGVKFDSLVSAEFAITQSGTMHWVVFYSGASVEVLRMLVCSYDATVGNATTGSKASETSVVTARKIVATGDLIAMGTMCYLGDTL